MSDEADEAISEAEGLLEKAVEKPEEATIQPEEVAEEFEESALQPEEADEVTPETAGQTEEDVEKVEKPIEAAIQPEEVYEEPVVSTIQPEKPAEESAEPDEQPEKTPKASAIPLIKIPDFKKPWASAAKQQEEGGSEDVEGSQQEDDDEELEFDSDQILTEDLFFKYVMQYAKRIDCFVEPSAEDAIHQEIEAMVDNGDLLTVEEAEMMVEDAADAAEKVSIVSMFGSRYTKEGLLILKGRHFRH